jgi:predicted secreted protein
MKNITHVVVTYPEEQYEASISVHAGDTLLVQIPGAAGTGFVWQVSDTPHLCSQRDNEVNPRTGRPLLAGGTTNQLMTFLVMRKGKEDINFIYSRPFEKGKPPIKRKVLHLTVE